MAWMPYEMPGVDPNFIKHELNVLLGARLVNKKEGDQRLNMWM